MPLPLEFSLFEGLTTPFRNLGSHLCLFLAFAPANVHPSASPFAQHSKCILNTPTVLLSSWLQHPSQRTTMAASLVPLLQLPSSLSPFRNLATWRSDHILPLHPRLQLLLTAWRRTSKPFPCPASLVCFSSSPWSLF